MVSSDHEDFPIDLETFLVALARMFKHSGGVKEVALLAESVPELRLEDYDNWNGGTYSWSLTLRCPYQLFVQVEEEREQIASKLTEKAKILFEEIDNHSLGFNVLPQLEKMVDWRRKASDWSRGKGVTNQGRVRSDSIAPKSFDGLLFRSEPEVNLYRALKSLGVPFAPLPVFIRGGNDFKRIEPDFLIIKDGLTLIVEVDGDSFHTETPATAQDRLIMLEVENVRVRRIKASDCDTLEKAKTAAQDILSFMRSLTKQKK